MLEDKKKDVLCPRETHYATKKEYIYFLSPLFGFFYFFVFFNFLKIFVKE
jgi:hypothetical protein